MLMHVWRLRVGSASATASRRLLWGSLQSRELSSSSDDEPLISHIASKKRKKETAKDLQVRQAKEFAMLPRLMRVYTQATGHCVVPYNLLVEDAKTTLHEESRNSAKRSRSSALVCGLVGSVSEINWPEEANGMNFGSAVNTFWRSTKHQSAYPEVTRQLMDMGVLTSGETHRELEWKKQTMPALRMYYNIYGDSLVPLDFEVPRDDAKWPVEARGLPLGRVVRSIRVLHVKQNLTAEEREDLQEVEFSFDVFEARWSEKVLPSLEVFAQLNGHCNVPQEFVVPKTAPWPRKAWGDKLGHTVNCIRSMGNFAEQAARDASRLKAIKFVWDHNEYQWTDRVLPSLETFHTLYSHCRVPNWFVVPPEAPWLQEAWGLPLGLTVNGIRAQGRFAEQIARDESRLEAIKFSWAPKLDRWSSKVLPALETFFTIHGHSSVPQSFVVPCEEPWPEETWGLNLGFTYANIRNQGTYAQQLRQDHARLEAIGFTIRKT